jgi:Na+/H+ antiporter NhaD/arsenite permease-like protein
MGACTTVASLLLAWRALSTGAADSFDVELSVGLFVLGLFLSVHSYAQAAMLTDYQHRLYLHVMAERRRSMARVEPAGDEASA